MTNPRFSDTEVKRAFQIADHVMKEKAKSFYQAFSRLPKARFKAVAAIYAFCRYADDLVDSANTPEQLSSAVKSLDVLENKLYSVYPLDENFHVTKTISSTRIQPNDTLPNDLTWWPAFEITIHEYRIPIQSFLDQIAAQRMDVDFVDIPDFDTLVDYCRKVAGSVGVMLMPVLAAEGVDTSDSGFIKACEHLGIGMQITNILRDVGEDMRTRDRVYLPADMLKTYGINRDTISDLSFMPDSDHVASLIPADFIHLWENLSDRANKYYSDYLKYLSFFHPSSRMPLVAAALSYRAIADAVRTQKYNCFTRRCYTNAKARAKIILEAQKRVRSIG